MLAIFFDYAKGGSIVEAGELRAQIESLIEQWDALFGKTGALPEATSKMLRRIDDRRVALELYYLMKPLEYYVMGLEEMLNTAFRDSVTRCGMYCERVANLLLYQLGQAEFVEKARFETKVGRLQNDLEKRGFPSAQLLCSTMHNVYFVRDKRGPHDVPAADEIEAKFCISCCPLIYSKYLDAMGLLGVKPGDVSDDFVKIVNSTLGVAARLALKPGGAALGARELVEVILYRNGFFSTPRNFEEIRREIEGKGYSIPKSSLAMMLKSLTGKGGFLTRTGGEGHYLYFQRLPPSEFYKRVGA